MQDQNNDGNCSENVAYGGGVQLQLRQTRPTAGSTTTATSDGSGNFTIPYSQPTGAESELRLVAPAGYTIRTSSVAPGPNLNAQSNPVAFDAPPNQTVVFCLGNVVKWFQTDIGDVRANTIEDHVPLGRVASESNPASIFYSSLGNSNFYAGQSSSSLWNINREYDFSDASSSKLGSAAYSFYMTQASRLDVDVQALPGCATTSNFSCLNRNNVYHHEGNLTIPGGNINGSENLVLLVSGNVTITGPIRVANGGVFTLAAKGDITINRAFGNAASDNVASNAVLQGIYTSENNIIIDGRDTPGCPANPDLRLNVWGALIANADFPFAENSSGSIQNRRSLCADDATYPSLKVYQRLNFLPYLSDLQKVKSRRWQEVAP